MGWMGWMGGVRGWGVGGEDVQWIVRGTKDAEFHPDILKKIEPALTSGGWQFEVEGGGKILHEPDKKSLKVFSKSTGFGKADHAKTTEILKTQFPEYDNVFWTEED